MTDQDIRRSLCDHDYGDMCESIRIMDGCVCTCRKCGQKWSYLAVVRNGEGLRGKVSVLQANSSTA